MALSRPLRPAYGTHDHFGLPLPDGPGPTDAVRDLTPAGMPAHAGSPPSRVLAIVAPTTVHDQRGTVAGWLPVGALVPVAKGIGAASQIVHVITDGRFAGRVIYRHRPTYQTPAPAIPIAVLGGEGPS